MGERRGKRRGGREGGGGGLGGVKGGGEGERTEGKGRTCTMVGVSVDVERAFNPPILEYELTCYIKPINFTVQCICGDDLGRSVVSEPCRVARGTKLHPIEGYRHTDAARCTWGGGRGCTRYLTESVKT